MRRYVIFVLIVVWFYADFIICSTGSNLNCSKKITLPSKEILQDRMQDLNLEEFNNITRLNIQLANKNMSVSELETFLQHCVILYKKNNNANHRLKNAITDYVEKRILKTLLEDY